MYAACPRPYRMPLGEYAMAYGLAYVLGRLTARRMGLIFMEKCHRRQPRPTSVSGDDCQMRNPAPPGGLCCLGRGYIAPDYRKLA